MGARLEVEMQRDAPEKIAIETHPTIPSAPVIPSETVFKQTPS